MAATGVDAYLLEDGRTALVPAETTFATDAATATSSEASEVAIRFPIREPAEPISLSEGSAEDEVAAPDASEEEAPAASAEGTPALLVDTEAEVESETEVEVQPERAAAAGAAGAMLHARRAAPVAGREWAGSALR